MADHRSGIALVGFMGAGKTTVGFALARWLQWPFVDLDATLAQRFGPVASQVRDCGLEVFRAREREAALALCDGLARVLSTGGGTLLDPSVRAALARHYVTVFLEVPLAVAATRVGGAQDRPLWDASVERRYEERQALYRTADLHLDATRPVEVLVEEIALSLELR